MNSALADSTSGPSAAVGTLMANAYRSLESLRASRLPRTNAALNECDQSTTVVTPVPMRPVVLRRTRA